MAADGNLKVVLVIKVTLLMWLIVLYEYIRFYGGHDLKFGVCFPEYIFEEGHEWKIRQWNELLCLLINPFSPTAYSLCNCCGGTAVVGHWLSASFLSNRTPDRLVITILPLFLFFSFVTSCLLLKLIIYFSAA